MQDLSLVMEKQFSNSDIDWRKIMSEKKRTMTVKQKKLVFNILIVLFAAVFVFCIVKIISYYDQGNKSKELNSSIIQEFVSYEESSEESSAVEGESKPKEYYHAPIPKSVNFDKLLAQNSDVVGWVFNQNGVINYPILQGEENSYYLNRLLDGRTNVNGSIFMESVNKGDFSDRNTIIYGHSMKNGTMFGTLLRYRNQSYYNAYPEFYIYTPQLKYRVDIFAAYESDTDDAVYNLFRKDAEFEDFISYAYGKSKIESDVDVQITDRIVTFSTCAYSYEDARFIVCGKLVEIN